ncbi:MAG: SDR family oxidoreductase, partial [Chloroflexota bacterium]
ELFPADVSEGYAEVQRMVDAVASAFGRLDILVNNAGQRSPQDSVADSNPEDMRRLLNTHFFGSYYCTKAAIPHLRRRERGDILFISSAATAQRPANRAPYVVAKSAVEAFADVVAKEERPNGIRVNTILAGIVETEWGEMIFRERGYDDVAAVYEYAPFGRLCRPEDIGNVIAFLCSDRGAYLTGAAIAVSGGPNDWMPPRR